MSRRNLGRKQLDSIGEEIVRCERSCAGVHNNPKNGVLPRCLFLEESDKECGAIVIGLNPGISDDKERTYYRESGTTYATTVEFWKMLVQYKHSYYCRLRELIRQSGLAGPLLWTELAKCEKAPDYVGALPVQTYRTCAQLFLKRELLVVPHKWIVFAIGQEAYKAAAYLLADRVVVGVPHPTGSRGQFSALFDNHRLRSAVKQRICAVVESESPLTEWLRK